MSKLRTATGISSTFLGRSYWRMGGIRTTLEHMKNFSCLISSQWGLEAAAPYASSNPFVININWGKICPNIIPAGYWYKGQPCGSFSFSTEENSLAKYLQRVMKKMIKEICGRSRSWPSLGRRRPPTWYNVDPDSLRPLSNPSSSCFIDNRLAYNWALSVAQRVA